jgi:hemerythrin-like domain-containing protein
MKRSAALQPLSREHHSALTLAKACERAAQSGDAAQVGKACERAIQAYANELEPHFQYEERSLLPLLHGAEMRPLVERTLADHRRLRGLLDGLRQSDVAALAGFGKCLAAHVRFEERELFQALESRLPPDMREYK